MAKSQSKTRLTNPQLAVILIAVVALLVLIAATLSPFGGMA